MRIKFVRSPVAFGYGYAVGDEVDLPKAKAGYLISVKVAKAVAETSEKAIIKGAEERSKPAEVIDNAPQLPFEYKTVAKETKHTKRKKK